MPAGEYVVLSVSDSGVGMAAETQAQIFEPFFTTKEKGKGTGLGLATVYGIVRQSGGWIEVTSEIGMGTTFTLYFPLSTSTGVALEPGSARASASSGATRGAILVVEDQPEVRQLAASALRQAGYEVREATDGDEALARFAAQARSIDLLVTDVVMPGLNGRELADRLRQHHPNLHVIFLSGYTDEVLDRQGILQSGAAFVPKPFTPSALVAEASRVLHGAVGAEGAEGQGHRGAEGQRA
jgi:CheY-like chemotaxis protein